MSFGKSHARLYAETGAGVTFADVAGVDEAKEALQEIIDFLRLPQKYTALDRRIPKGVLLIGPPGTGKTLLARAVAGEASVLFFSLSGADFVEMCVGVGAARVRDLFKQAQAESPAIVVIDELDAVGKACGINPMQQNDEREQTLNQLLAEMDGFDPRKGVILLAATNRPEILDPAPERRPATPELQRSDSPDNRPGKHRGLSRTWPNEPSNSSRRASGHWTPWRHTYGCPKRSTRRGSPDSWQVSRPARNGSRLP